MLDWFSGLVGYSGDSLQLNRVYELSPAGEIIWQTEGKLQVPGSHDSNIRVTRGFFTPNTLKHWDFVDYLSDSKSYLRLDGNPSKFLQGHNAFGCSVLDTGLAIKEVVKRFPDELRPNDFEFSVPDGEPFYHANRLDINTSVDFGNDRDVHDWLRVAATSLRTRHKIRHERDTQGLTGGATVYWGKHSKRWTIKAYCKYCEMPKHKSPDPEMYEAVHEYERGKLRIELTLRTPELDKFGSSYYTISEGLIWDYFARIEVGVMKKDIVKGRKPNLKPPAVDMAFTMWKSGIDLSSYLPTRTFYHYRRIILEETGLSISNAPDEKQIERQNFDIDWLKAHEVVNIPGYLQQYIFTPNGYKDYQVSLF